MHKTHLREVQQTCLKSRNNKRKTKIPGHWQATIPKPKASWI